MLSLSGKKERARLAELRDPREGEAWFDELPPELRAELTERWRREQEHWVDLGLNQRRGHVRSLLGAGGLFGVFDLLCSHGSAATALALTLVGALTGVVWIAGNAGRLTTPVYGMLSFTLALYVSRGGISPQHLFMIFVLGAACAWIGIRREDAGYL